MNLVCRVSNQFGIGDEQCVSFAWQWRRMDDELWLRCTGLFTRFGGGGGGSGDAHPNCSILISAADGGRHRAGHC